jgi:hypothetical protein
MPPLLRTGALAAVAGTAFAVAPHLGASFNDSFGFKVAALALGGAFAAAFVIRAPALRLARYELAALGFLAVALVSWCIHPPVHAFGAFPVVCPATALVVAVAMRIAVQQRADTRALVLDLVVATAAIVALLAIAESLGFAVPWSDERRPESTLGNRNFVGAYAAVALPLALTRVMQRPLSWRSPALVAIALVLVVTRSRSAWLGAMAATAIVGAAAGWNAVRHRGARRLGGLVAAVALCGGVTAGAVAPWPGLHWAPEVSLSSTIQRIGEYDRGSGKGRIDQHRIAWAIVRSAPVLGVGPHGWGDAASEHADVVPGGHAAMWLASSIPSSDVVRVAAETGVAGTLAGLATLSLLATSMLRRVRTHPKDRSDGIAIGAALLCMGVHGLFDAPLYRPETLGLAAVLAGAVPQVAPDGSPWHAPTGKVVAGLAAAASSAVAVAIVASTIIRWDGSTDALLRAQRWYARPDRQERLVAHLSEEGRCPEAIAAFGAAMQWTPHIWGPRVAVRRCVESPDAR